MANKPTETDFLIAGGGIQGVTLLHELTAAGARRIFLASEGELGVGETLHSHGYMHHGYTMSAAGDAAEPLVRELKEAAAWWRDRIRVPYAPGPQVYFSLRAPTAAERIALWDRFGLAHREIVDIPPALSGGAAIGDDVRLFSIDDRLVSMRDLLSDLAAPLQNRIVQARLTAIELDESGSHVTGCKLSAERGEFLVRPRVLLVACGRHAQPLLRSARTPSGRRPLQTKCAGLNRIRFVPMLLVRGSRLPEVSGLFETHALSLLTHPVSADESMWILTLTQGHETVRGDFDPSRERAAGGGVVAETVSRLMSLVPEARGRRDSDLRFGFYFGAKLDHPDGGNGRYVDDCGLANLRLAWPGVWSLSRTNASEIARDLRSTQQFADLFDRSGEPVDLKEAGLITGAPVGEELRLGTAQTWHPWAEFRTLQDLP